MEKKESLKEPLLARLRNLLQWQKREEHRAKLEREERHMAHGVVMLSQSKDAKRKRRRQIAKASRRRNRGKQ